MFIRQIPISGFSTPTLALQLAGLRVGAKLSFASVGARITSYTNPIHPEKTAWLFLYNGFREKGVIDLPAWVGGFGFLGFSWLDLCSGAARLRANNYLHPNTC